MRRITVGFDDETYKMLMKLKLHYEKAYQTNISFGYVIRELIRNDEFINELYCRKFDGK